LRRIAEADELPLGDFEQRLREARDEGVALDETTLMAVERAIEKAASQFASKPDDLELLERWESIVAHVRAARVEVDLRKPQNEYYRLKKSRRPMMAANAGNGSSTANRWLQHFDALGEKLAISPEARG
jgi:hypothetical protein